MNNVLVIYTVFCFFITCAVRVDFHFKVSKECSFGCDVVIKVVERRKMFLI